MNKATKICLYSTAALFGSFVVYANLEPAPLHARAVPVTMTILRVNNELPQTKYDEVRRNIETETGVTACAANAENKIVSITFDPEKSTILALQEKVAQITKSTVEKAVFENVSSSGPQCPVPQEYIIAFERVKYAFCFR